MELPDIDCELQEVAEVEYAEVPAPFPNPFDDVINLPSASASTPMDITGKVVQDAPTTSTSIATEELPAGCYLLRSQDTVEPRTYRMIKE